jgi:hypothetical protein
MKRRPLLFLLVAVLAALAAPAAPAAPAAAAPAVLAALAAPGRSLDDYHRFRALSIDLAGRAPTRAELDAFETPGFDLDHWIDQHLEGPGYVERLERIYMDLLRLEVGPAFQFIPPSTTLHRQTIMGPDKKPVYVYYRFNQRRERPETDGEFCLSQADTGLLFPNGQPPRGTAIPVKQKALDAATVMVRPWWLYKDYKSPSPKARYGLDWGGEETGYELVKEMIFEPDGTTPTTEVRVCREEAQAPETGHVFVTGRTPPPKGTPPPKDRLRFPPADDGYAKQHKGEEVSCRGATAMTMSHDCGCGAGLEHCVPGDGVGNEPRAFSLPNHFPLGVDVPFDAAPQNTSSWTKFWWSQEARRFMNRLFGEDRDFREALTARWSFVNGPLAEFYRSGARSSCCGRERAFKMIEETEPLFSEAAVPKDLAPMDATHWDFVPDRGQHAAGLITMPVFLAKYASRRARGAAVYTAFLCKSFVAENMDLKPSSEPNLMVREGCSTCHATLEPLAAYFSRVEETNWVFLPSSQFPAENPVCKKNAQGKMPGFCDFFYDAAFSSATAGKLRGAYASTDHAGRGPAGIGADVTSQPEFASCAVERVASSFLGRPLRDDDQKLVEELRAGFVSSGYRMRPLVGALVRSGAYLSANDDRSSLRQSALPEIVPTHKEMP